jgi:hypothetical protein
MKCENYPGITLLNVAYKIKYHAGTVERVLRRDFGRVPVRFQTTADQIFVVRQILEKFYARDIDLHLFIYFKKTFDSINQKKKLLESLVSFGISKKIE